MDMEASSKARKPSIPAIMAKTDGFSQVQASGDHYFPSAACAAASRAIGTRNGEQLT